MTILIHNKLCEESMRKWKMFPKTQIAIILLLSLTFWCSIWAMIIDMFPTYISETPIECYSITPIAQDKYTIITGGMVYLQLDDKDIRCSYDLDDTRSLKQIYQIQELKCIKYLLKINL